MATDADAATTVAGKASSGSATTVESMQGGIVEYELELGRVLNSHWAALAE